MPTKDRNINLNNFIKRLDLINIGDSISVLLNSTDPLELLGNIKEFYEKIGEEFHDLENSIEFDADNFDRIYKLHIIFSKGVIKKETQIDLSYVKGEILDRISGLCSFVKRHANKDEPSDIFDVKLKSLARYLMSFADDLDRIINIEKAKRNKI